MHVFLKWIAEYRHRVIVLLPALVLGSGICAHAQIWVTSGFTSGPSAQQITAFCSTSAVDPATGQVSPAAAAYPQFYATCAVTPSPGVSAVCSGGNPTAQCSIVFQPQPGVSYTINSYHTFRWNVNPSDTQCGPLPRNVCLSDPLGYYPNPGLVNSWPPMPSYSGSSSLITADIACTARGGVCAARDIPATWCASPVNVFGTPTCDPAVLVPPFWPLATTSAVYMPLSIVANINTGQDQIAAVSNSLTSTFPLGADFTIALVDATGNAIPSNYELSSPSVTGNVPQGALFPNSVVFQYSNDVSDRGAFHAAHLGNVTLTITQTDSQSGATSVNVNIVVVNPASLGSSHTEVDDLIYPIANKTGIPPNFIKAQMAQESSSQFIPLAYRYEPLSQDAAFVSRGQDLRTSTFAQYRFATVMDSNDPALTQGAKVDSTDRATVGYFPCCGPAPTALQIMNTYDGIENWSKQPGATGRLSKLKANDFTAQTSLASSYGFMQMTYATAITYMHWQGVGGLRNPTLLFDTSANLQSGGGSLNLANQFLQKIYSAANPELSIDPSLQISDPGEFIETFRPAWQRYNGAATYPGKVISRIQTYAAIAADSIFSEN